MKYSSKTTGFLAGFAIVLCAASVQANNKAVEAALSSHSEISMFTQAIMDSGVAAELKEGKQYTVFAPTNAAFTRVMPQDPACYQAPACKAKVAAIVRNHIVPGKSPVDVMAGAGSVHTMGGRAITVQKSSSGDEGYTVGGNGVVKETDSDGVMVYSMQGVIASSKDMAAIQHMQPGAAVVDSAPVSESKPVVSPALMPPSNPLRTPIVPPMSPTRW